MILFPYKVAHTIVTEVIPVTGWTKILFFVNIATITIT